MLEAGADPNKDFTSPLRYAISHKDYELAKMLVDKGANVNYQDILTTDTILYTAIKKKQYDIASLLISKGAKIDGKTYRKIKNNNLERRLGINLS